MDINLRSSSVGSLSRTESSSGLTPSNERGIGQKDGTASRLSSVSFTMNESEPTPSVKPLAVKALAYDGGDLRASAGSDKSWGRFKNWLADKLPFVGKTTYGTILQKADAYSIREVGLTPREKAGALLSLKQSIESWQQKHPTATGGKADGIAQLGQAVDAALRKAEGQIVLEQRFPAALERPSDYGAPYESDGPLPEGARTIFTSVLGDDAMIRNSNGTLNNVDESGSPSVSFSFHKDFVVRQGPLVINDGALVAFDNKHSNGVDARQALAKLTGDDELATSLSHYIGQNMMAPLETAKVNLLLTESGSPNYLLATNAQTFHYEVSKNPPSGNGGEPSYTITYTTLDPITRMGIDDETYLRFNDSELAMSFQIQVKESDLRAGNGAFTISREPGFGISLKPDLDQAASMLGKF